MTLIKLSFFTFSFRLGCLAFRWDFFFCCFLRLRLRLNLNLNFHLNFLGSSLRRCLWCFLNNFSFRRSFGTWFRFRYWFFGSFRLWTWWSCAFFSLFNFFLSRRFRLWLTFWFFSFNLFDFHFLNLNFCLLFSFLFLCLLCFRLCRFFIPYFGEFLLLFPFGLLLLCSLVLFLLKLLTGLLLFCFFSFWIFQFLRFDLFVISIFSVQLFLLDQ